MTDRMQTCDCMVRAGLVITQDDSRTIIADGAVAVDQGIIISVGKAHEMKEKFTPRSDIDLGKKMLMPGLVNAHCHAPMSLLRGVADDLPLMQWLEKYIWPIESGLTREMVAIGAELACAEMMRTGTTAFMDGYFHEDVLGEVAESAGLRAVLGEGFFAFPSPFFATAEDCWQTIESHERRFSQSPFVRNVVTPHALYTVSPELLSESYELACKLDIPWQIHCAESPAETAQCIELYGMRPLAILESLGLLNDRVTLAHCVDVLPEEIELLSERCVNVVHNPASNHKLDSGIAPVQAMLDAGVNVGLGTDGAASNNQLNMFADMRMAALVGKVQAHDAAAVKAQNALDMATRGSAQCIHWEGLGMLVPGASADMIALDTESPNLMPMHNPISQTVYAASGHEVAMTMVAGHVVYRDGEYSGIDMASLQVRMNEVVKWVRERIS